MGSSSSRRSDEPEYLKQLIEVSQKEFKKYQTEKDETIQKIKEELINDLNSKDKNSSKEKMKKILKAEDDTIIYNILDHCLKTLKEKTSSLSENKECPMELKAALNTMIYAAPKYKIKELKEFRNVFKEKYGSKYIDKVDDNEEHLVNEVLIEKLNINNYSEQLLTIRLKLICQEKKIDSQFLENMNQRSQQGSEQNKNSIRKISTIHSSLFSHILENKSSLNKEELEAREKAKKNKESINKEENKDDKYLEEFKECVKNNPLDRVKTIEVQNESLMIIKEGENLFLPYDEKIDEKCYNINKIENWAEKFYNLKKGIILEKYKELISKTEFKKFFEALNYEYGINNYPLDLKKAFEIYKTAADTTTDTLSMYRLYHIYKKDFKKFDINERNHVLELFYIMKSFAYSTSYDKENYLLGKFCLAPEIKALILDENNYFYKWYSKYFEFIQKNYNDYNISKDDAILIEVVIYYYFEKKESKKTEEMDDKIFDLIDEENLHAIYNCMIYYNDFNEKYCEQLYDKNYYRSFADYAKAMPNEKKDKALTMLKKSIENGYIEHIKEYFHIFMMNNEIENIIKTPSLKSELIFIINCLLDNIILDRIDFLFDLNYMRNVLIKHYNFENEFKDNIDNLLKEIMNYLNMFLKGKDDENKNKIKLYFNQDYYSLMYTLYGNICFSGMKGILEKNYDETLNKYNYLLKNDEGSFIDRFYLYYIYMIKNKQRKNVNNKKEDKELIALEKKLLDLFYADVSVEKIKTFPPSFFYYLSRLFRNNTINTKDLILEYVFLNRASNAKIIKLKNVDCQIFEEKYLINKAKMKIKEKNKEENFKKLFEEKGAINVEGYGEDGMICPICLDNKKSIIALPCKHFFCSTCMKRLLDDGSCPICRTEIKITFDINLKKESLIKSKIYSSYLSFEPSLISADDIPDDPFGGENSFDE